MKRLSLSAVFVLAGSLGIAAGPRPAFQRPVAVQEPPAPRVPSRPPRASRRKIVSLENLPGEMAFDKLRNLFNSRIRRTPSKEDLNGEFSGWIAFADAPDSAVGALLTGNGATATVFSSPRAKLDAYDHLTEAELSRFKTYAVKGAPEIPRIQISKDAAAYKIQQGAFKGTVYSFRKLKEGLAVRASRPEGGDLMYAFFFKTVTPPAP